MYFFTEKFNTIRYPKYIIEFIREIGLQGLDLQSHEGAMPAGRNGPHNHWMTPVRNTGHWSVLFSFLYKNTGDKYWKKAAEKALNFLISPTYHPLKGAFWQRKHLGKSSYNGLIGQAWTLEALYVGGKVLDHDDYLEISKNVVKLHPFDRSLGLWREIDIAGAGQNIGTTLNQQIWFTAMALYILPNPENLELTDLFLKKLVSNSRLRNSGLLYTQTFVKPSEIHRLLYYIYQMYFPRKDCRKEIDSGYHLFTLLGLAHIYKIFPTHVFFKSNFFARLLKFSFTEKYIEALSSNRFGYPYNVPGLEFPYVWEVFSQMIDYSAYERVLKVLTVQIKQNYSVNKKLFAKNTSDPETLAARGYEICRISSKFWNTLQERIDEDNFVHWALS